MKKLLIVLVFLLPGSLTWLSCGGSSKPATKKTSGVAYRAFISNSVSAGTTAAGVYIVNAATDVKPAAAAISAGSNPGMMVVTPNLAQTLVFSGNGTQTSDNQFTIITNATESAAFQLSLPGMTESFVVSPDSSTAYVAVPTAPVTGQSPGVVEVISIGGGSETAEADVPSVHYLSIDNSGDRVFGFSDNSDSVAIITPSNLGIGNPNDDAVAYVGGFDRPVAAFFSSDDTTAYVVNCGAECGGKQASMQEFDLTTNTLERYVPVCAPGTTSCGASVALINSGTMFLAGTPYTAAGSPSQFCPAGTTQATYCGLLTMVNLDTMTVANSAPIIITDGYHDRIALGANGQLFIGARTCTEITTSTETRGCLSIYNTLNAAVGSASPGGVLIPPANGDVTGLQPIAKRADSNGVAQEVVYVVQGGSLNIYDVTIDALEYNPNNTNNPGEIFGLVGQFVDVKTVDF